MDSEKLNCTIQQKKMNFLIQFQVEQIMILQARNLIAMSSSCMFSPSMFA